MSFSICLNCAQPVAVYEKYCFKCEKLYKQEKDYWKTNHPTKEERRDELKKDKIKKY